MVEAMLEDNLRPPAHFTIQYIGKSQYFWRLGTHQLILRRGGHGIYMKLEYLFWNLLINLCKRRVILEGGMFFSKIP